ncbi:MAG: hypothetical protein IE909_04905 [Campylobacterales bacterium]|nr:hypothetical protein [Campylobacterales bacterium]
MSGYSRLALTASVLSLSIFGCATQSNVEKHHDYRFELNYMMAIDGEFMNNPKQALEYYKQLFKTNKTHEINQKIVSYAFKNKQYNTMIEYSKKGYELFAKHFEYYKQQQVIGLISQKKYNEALKIALELLQSNKTSFNYEIVANVYYVLKDYDNASKYYESAYLQNKNSQTLIKLVSILYSYLNQKDIALAYLETHVQQNGCDNGAICEKLLLIYQENNNLDGMITILSKMYYKYKPQKQYEAAVQLLESNIIALLEKKDIKKAIKFLEENSTDTTKLLNLYYQDGQFDNALQLVRKLYKKTKDPELLGKIAMYQFEGASDKSKILKHVIANFELALSSGINNPSYHNYYGYLLIDYNIDVPKGVELVKTALQSQPNNLAYLDSLAWGYYKLGLCDEAFSTINKVIKIAGLKDPEIKYHWDMITNCKKDIK